MNISGSGRIAGGEYNEKITVSGSGKLCGNVRCIALRCSGDLEGDGSLKCSENIETYGSCSIKQDVEAISIDGNGSLDIGGSVRADEKIEMHGVIECSGDVKCAVLDCSGGVCVGGEIEAEQISVSGKIRCKGLLNADKIEIDFGGLGMSCKIGSVGGSEIKLRNKKRVFAGILTVDELIEGDTVLIECVKAPKVVGRIVTVGKKCDVELLQYSEKVEIHPRAKVGKCEKI